MCVDNPVFFHSDKPIVAYKVMSVFDNNVQSVIAGNTYELGITYAATDPMRFMYVNYCEEYDVGFHAYETMQDAKTYIANNSWNTSSPLLKIVEVELSEITHKGTQRAINYERVWTYVAKQCKFIRIVE